MVRELGQQCQCNLDRDQVTSAAFRCFLQSPTAVTFRMEMTVPTDFQLASSLEAWVSSGPSILVQTERLHIDDACTVLISSFSEEECGPSTTLSVPATSAVGNTAVIGAVIGVVVFLVAMAAVTVLTILILWKWRRKAKASRYVY